MLLSPHLVEAIVVQWVFLFGFNENYLISWLNFEKLWMRNYLESSPTIRQDMPSNVWFWGWIK